MPLHYSTKSASGKFLSWRYITVTTHKSHRDCFWRRHCCQNNVQTCAGSQSLRLTKIPQLIVLLFSHKHFPTLSVLLLFQVSYSISADAGMRSFLFHSGSSLPLILHVSVFKCEWVCISDIIHPLTSHSPYGSFDHFKARSGDTLRRGSNLLSAARRFAKSIVANEGFSKRKPQYKLNKLR